MLPLFYAVLIFALGLFIGFAARLLLNHPLWMEVALTGALLAFMFLTLPKTLTASMWLSFLAGYICLQPVSLVCAKLSDRA